MRELLSLRSAHALRCRLTTAASDAGCESTSSEQQYKGHSTGEWTDERHRLAMN